jgi:ubiquinol-cytochrome c reductase cytochrome c subunit
VARLAGRLPLALPLVAGFIVAAFSHSVASSQTAPPSANAKTIYLGDCATCHGAQGAGTSQGPSLLGSGTAGLNFYLSTGRMPLASPTQTVARRPPRYDEATQRALIAFVAAFPNFRGPAIPATPSLAAADIARGGVLYRLNCAACHAWSGRGGALLHRDAPSLPAATPTQIIEAMLIGPGSMPSFGTNAITPNERIDVAAYTRQVSRNPDDRGGFPLWHLGPLPEGAVAIFAGLILLLALARFIGTRA